LGPMFGNRMVSAVLPSRLCLTLASEARAWGLGLSEGGTAWRIVFLLVAVGVLTGSVAYMAPKSGQADEEAAPILGVTILPGYRDWRLISVAHEEGSLNDLRAILGNDIAIKAYREGKLPFPNGTIIARLAWDYVSSEETTKPLAVSNPSWPGVPKNGVQFMV